MLDPWLIRLPDTIYVKKETKDRRQPENNDLQTMIKQYDLICFWFLSKKSHCNMYFESTLDTSFAKLFHFIVILQSLTLIGFVALLGVK